MPRCPEASRNGVIVGLLRNPIHVTLNEVKGLLTPVESSSRRFFAALRMTRGGFFNGPIVPSSLPSMWLTDGADGRGADSRGLVVSLCVMEAVPSLAGGGGRGQLAISGVPARPCSLQCLGRVRIPRIDRQRRLKLCDSLGVQSQV